MGEASGFGKKTTLGAHLLELRRRLGRGAAAVLVGSIAGWFLSSFVLSAMRAPITVLSHQQHRVASLNYDSISSAFDLKIQIAVTVGLIISSPIWLYQVWAFFVPALTRKEVKHALGFLLSAIPLFIVGCATGWILVPHMVQLMTSFAPAESTSFIQAGNYFTFVLKLVIAVGIAFVLPVFIVLLNFVGVISARAIIRSWRVALIAIVVFTGIVTPSADVVSMFLLAIPIMLLFLAAATIALAHDRRAARSRDRITHVPVIA